MEDPIRNVHDRRPFHFPAPSLNHSAVTASPTVLACLACAGGRPGMSARGPWWRRWLHYLAFLPEPSRRVGLTGRRTLLLARRVFLALLLLPTLSAGFAAPAAAQSPSTVPMVSITGGPSVTEGADATFTLTASPAPSADITVNVNVADSGSFAVHGQTGPRAVTVGMNGTGSLTVATVNDGVDDWSGAITATVQAGDGYTVSSPSLAAVAVLNDGVQLPDLTVYLAQDPNLDLSKITEGNEIFFEVVPSWPTNHPLPVALKTTQTGDFIAEKFLYAYLHEMDSIANWVFYVLIDNDDIDEPDGSVTAISEYGNGRTSNSVTVPIIDDDPTVVSLARAGSGAVGTGGKVAFTVTLGRALVAGETIDVPLAISGAGVSVNGYTLSVTGGTGATLWGTGVLTPVLRFSGAGARAATLELVPAVGSTAGQYTIALGPDGTGANGFDRAGLGTNVGGGADPSTTQNGFDVQVASATQATKLVTPQATEPVTPRVNLSSGAGGTEGETVEFTLVVTPPPPPLEVTLMVGQNGDYVGSAALGRRTVTVPTSGSVTVTVPTVDDGADEPDGTVTATLEAGSGYTLGALGTLAVDVADNDGLPLLSFAEQRVDVVEGATTDAVLTVNLNEKSYKPVTFDYTLSGKATAGEDYESPQSRSVSIPPGSTSADLVFKIKDDPRHESLEPIIVTLIDPMNALAPAPGNSAVVLIASDDGPPVLSVEASSVQEPPPGYARYMPFALTLAPASGYEVVVDVADTKTGTATSASSCPGNCVGTRDYVTGRSRVRFAPGETYKVVNFGVRGDAVDEEDETIVVRLSAASRQVTFADGTLSGTRWSQEVAGTIEDDDERGIEVTPAALALAEPDGAGSYEVALTSQPTHVVAIDLSSSDPAVATVSPARLTFTPGSWDKPQAVTVTVVDDDNAGGARTATISHAVTAGTSDYGAVTVPDVTVTVSGGEAAPSVVSTQVADPVTVSLSAEQSAIAEANGKTKFRIALSRTLGAGEVVKVPFTITGGKWKRDWHVKFQDAHNGPGVERTRSGRKSAVRFTKGGRVATLVLVARPNEDTEARTISISFGTGKRAPRSTGVAGGLALVDKPIAVAIIDDDWGIPAVTVAAGGAVTEGGDATFTLRADPAPIADLAVTVGVTQIGTVADTVTLGPRTVTIPAGATEGAFTVATTDDGTDGPGGAVTATVVKKAGYTLGETTAA
ncbi:MAG: hypothetical protein F4142_08630, partial [Nitrospira sp. SB0675_bin_23]|nr:hypothetical protein [Nitrospira sp. SB0667_bin_9]MYH02622.1 hypothetical protein [Nitrospira sp. SB0675_bin_23]MYJ21876.1 hypothetical protein [Nitrospira sp. SB0673_bin_12]